MRKSRTRKADPASTPPPEVATKPASIPPPAVATEKDAAAGEIAGEIAVDAMAEMPAPGEEKETSSQQRLSAELQEAKDRAMRIQAELENYRKRVARQTEEQLRYANLPLMRDLLPVLDNMERAIEAAEKARNAAGLLEGFKMVLRQFEDVLVRHHCVRIEALGSPFDPHLHEAISQQHCEEHPAGTIVQVTQTGFQLHDRVVRPSQVIVSAASQ